MTAHLIEMAASGLLGWNLAILALESAETHRGRPHQRAGQAPQPNGRTIISIEPPGSDLISVEYRQPAE